jgi:hypothetical protein
VARRKTRLAVSGFGIALLAAALSVGAAALRGGSFRGARSTRPEEADTGPCPQALVSPEPAETPTPATYLSRVETAGNPCQPPTFEETIIEERIGSGPVVRFYTRGHRVEESERYRSELSALPTGRLWPWYRSQIEALGFSIVDAAWGARDRPNFALEKNGIRFRLELSCDSEAHVTRIDAGPNL